MDTKIRAGLATWVGLIGAAAGVLIPMLGELADAAAPLGVPAAVWTIAGAALGVAVVLGRMAQAVANIVAPLPGHIELAIDELPADSTDTAASK